MEGPSLFLAQEQLQPFIGKKILKVSGNSKIGIERLQDLQAKDIFSWGKHLIFQFEHFGFRVHFLLFGTFQAIIDGKFVTGDYKKKAQSPRLLLEFENGHIEMYSCSVKYVEENDIRKTYDFTASIMSPEWDSSKAVEKMKAYPDEEIADVLLDQDIFAGVGNIIKNEVLWLAKVSPKTKVSALSNAKTKEIVEVTKTFSLQFYEWRKIFELKKHYQIYRQKECPREHSKVIREKTGKKQRWSFYCQSCQKLN